MEFIHLTADSFAPSTKYSFADLCNAVECIRRDFSTKPMEKFRAGIEIHTRVNFLKKYLKSTGKNAYVLGISGGVDSLVAGLLAQQACAELRAEGYDAKFMGVSLPYASMTDNDPSLAALDFIKADYHGFNCIDESCDTVFGEVVHYPITTEQFSGLELHNDIPAAHYDFHFGNVKARMRMIFQYFYAGLHNGLVLGTDHNAECITGFFTKHGDGACDLIPLQGLNKRQVRAIAKHYGAPEELYNRVATANLEGLRENLPDESALGVTYDEIDDLLEGKTISPQALTTIAMHYLNTAHKRSGPVGPYNTYNSAINIKKATNEI